MEIVTLGLVVLAVVLFFSLRGRTQKRRSEAEEAARRAVERRMDKDS